MSGKIVAPTANPFSRPVPQVGSAGLGTYAVYSDAVFLETVFWNQAVIQKIASKKKTFCLEKWQFDSAMIRFSIVSLAKMELFASFLACHII